LIERITHTDTQTATWSLEDGLYLLTELSPSWEAANCAAIQETPCNFKESEGSSPCSQEPSTGPYPEPVRSSPYHPKDELYFSKIKLAKRSSKSERIVWLCIHLLICCNLGFVLCCEIGTALFLINIYSQNIGFNLL
jgi:hypothetical protein